MTAQTDAAVQNGDEETQPKETEKMRNATVVLLSFLVVPLLIVIAMLAFLEPKMDPEYRTGWLLALFSILATTAGMFRFTVRTVEELSERIGSLSEETKEKVHETVRRELRNSRIPLHNKDEVRDEVTRLFDEAADAKTESERVIHYYGGASLYPSDQEIKEINEAIDKDQSASKPGHDMALAYRAAFQRITEAGTTVIFRRYIKLPSKEELQFRSLDYLERLQAWLVRQRETIKKCPNFTLYRAARTYEFNSLTSVVAGPSGVVEIIGEGDAGAVVRSHSERRNFIAAVGSFMNAAKGKNKPEPLNQDTILDLERIIRDVEAAIETKKSAEKAADD